MKIGKDWLIESDGDLNIIVKHARNWVNRKTGEPYQHWDVMGYFATLDHALNYLVDQRVRQSGLTDLKTLAQNIDDIKRDIDAAVGATAPGDTAVLT